MKNKLVFTDFERRVLDALSNSGAHIYVVGGSVRDLVFFKMTKSHDYDIELFGLDLEQIESILGQFGYVNKVGKSFGILKLDVLPNFDFAIPRIEKAIGLGHRDFEVQTNPNLTIQEAAIRRDFTINSLYYEYQTGEIIDCFGGIDDGHHRILRAVNSMTFQEDPLRILRLAKFLSRFDFMVESKTKQIVEKMIVNKALNQLSTQRVYEEYKGILLANQPSIGLQFLYTVGALPKYLEILGSTHQRADYHPEGDVLKHTLLVTNLGALCKQKTSNPEGFMWACLLHDLGKAKVTTPTGSAPEHQSVGATMLKQVFKEMAIPKFHHKYIELMVLCHMDIAYMARKNIEDAGYYRLLAKIDNIVPIEDLVLLSKCDKLGRGMDNHDAIKQMDDYLEDKQSRITTKLEAIITGKLLVELGYQPGKLFTDIIRACYKEQMNGKNKQQLIQFIEETYKR